MTAVLTSRGLRDYVDGTILRPDDGEKESPKAIKDWERLDAAAYCCIDSCVKGSASEIVRYSVTAAEA